MDEQLILVQSIWDVSEYFKGQSRHINHRIIDYLPMHFTSRISIGNDHIDRGR